MRSKRKILRKIHLTWGRGLYKVSVVAYLEMHEGKKIGFRTGTFPSRQSKFSLKADSDWS